MQIIIKFKQYLLLIMWFRSVVPNVGNNAPLPPVGIRIISKDGKNQGMDEVKEYTRNKNGNK